jgi:effector-binding domain-containing protein
MVEMLRSRMPAAVCDRTPGAVEIVDLHPRETAVIRIDVEPSELKSTIGPALTEVADAMSSAGVDLAGPPFTRYLQWHAERVVAEVGFPVMRPAPGVGRVEPASLPAGAAASIVHLGPYETLGETYDRLQVWFSEQGRHAADDLWEVYWSDPQAEPDPGRWRTEIIRLIV